MAIRARAIITAALEDLGVVTSGSPLTADDAVLGLARLNNMVSGWITQYGTVLGVSRYIFPLTADQQSYTIGLGGDFNVPRPSTIIGAGLWLDGLAAAQSVTSITRSGTTATVTQTAHGFAVGDEAYLAGATQIEYNGLQTVQTVPTADTYTFTVSSNATSPATGTITAQAVEGQPVELPRTVITDSAYQSIQLKNLPNSQFTNVYYFPNQPQGTAFGTIFLWPRPDTAENQLVLYLQNLFTGFADLNTLYEWPDTPGYAEALHYNLAIRLAVPFGRPVPEDCRALANHTLGLIKRANNKLVDLPTDATLLTHWPSGLYNINSGTTQGTGGG